MRIAVMSLTRDRLDYTQHCFYSLRDNAGCTFDHYVLDQGSTDGTAEWLRKYYKPKWLETVPDNIGVSRGINKLLEWIVGYEYPYDVIVKFDNDCEVVTPDTLRVAAEVAMTGEWIVSPHIQGLNDPPSIGWEDVVLGYRIGVPHLIGGIFMAAPASVYSRYQHSEANPIWGMDDVNLCSWWRNNDGQIGYLLDYPAWHYESTEGQRARYPEYFARKDAEYAA